MPRIFVRHIRPKREPFDFDAFKSEMVDELNQTVRPDVLKDFKKTQASWENQVQFSSRLIIKTNLISLSVVPTGVNKEQWKLVSAGSPPHPIVPKRPGGRLGFRAGYLPATKPGRIQSFPGFSFGRRVVTSRVDHPGFVGRNFPELIADKHDKTFRNRITNALRRATRRLARST